MWFIKSVGVARVYGRDYTSRVGMNNEKRQPAASIVIVQIADDKQRIYFAWCFIKFNIPLTSIMGKKLKFPPILASKGTVQKSVESILDF